MINKILYKIKKSSRKSRRCFGICRNNKITLAIGRGAGSHNGGVLIYFRCKRRPNGKLCVTIEKTKRYRRMMKDNEDKK